VYVGADLKINLVAGVGLPQVPLRWLLVSDHRDVLNPGWSVKGVDPVRTQAKQVPVVPPDLRIAVDDKPPLIGNPFPG